MRLLAPPLLALAFVLPSAAADWVSVVKDVERKVPRVQMQWADGSQGSCSAVFLNATSGYLVTAAHCVEDGDKRPDVTVAGRDAAVVRSNRILDLAVLRVDPVNSDVTCALAKATPPRGTEVAIAGYAFGLQQMPMQFGRISLPYLRDDGVTLVNVDLIAGDSGGAVLDTDGALVGIVSAVRYAGPMHIGITIPVERIRDYTSQYLPQPAPPQAPAPKVKGKP